MNQLHTDVLVLQDEIKNSSSKIVLVGPIKLTKIFALECYSINSGLYQRITHFMDDKYAGNRVIEREIVSLETMLDADMLYYIISSSDNGMFVMYKKLIALGIKDENIFIQEPTNFITKELMNTYNINNFNIIECGAFGGTGQIFKMEKTLKNKMKIYAFEADKNEIDNLKSQEKDKYFLFNKIIDSSVKNNRKLYCISSSGAWSFHRPNQEITDNYVSIYAMEKNKIYEEIITNETTTIDNIILEIADNIDYLYINIDSAEYYAIEGSVESLRDKAISVVEIEVYFNDYYENQPLFADVDKLMKKNGYELLNFRNPNILIPVNAPFQIGKEKLIHFNAIYTHNKIDVLNLNNVLKHISILELLGFPLKAFDMIKKTLIIYKNQEFENVILKIFEKYATIYNSRISIETFLEN